MTTPRLIVFGDGRHGKDTACEYLRDRFDLPFASSSWVACELFLFDQLKDEYGYRSKEECYEDRHNHRKLWYEAIRNFNDPDLCRLARHLFANYDVYCGIRHHEEFAAIRKEGLADIAVWIDASKRLPPESRESMSLTAKDADVVIDNNGTLEDLYRNLDNTFEALLRRAPRPALVA